MIEIKHLYKSYGKQLVLDDINLSIQWKNYNKNHSKVFYKNHCKNKNEKRNKNTWTS